MLRECSVCGATEALHVHHLDWDHGNNSPANLLRVCQRCHVELHRVGYLTRDELLRVREAVRLRQPERFQPELGDQRGSGDLL